MKVCGHCGVAKPLDAYSPSRRNREHALCRECMNERVQEYQRRNKDQQAKNVVRHKTTNRIAEGEFAKPGVCQRCGAPNPQTHHRSYDRLDSYRDVEFLCEPCHRKEHK